MHFYRSRVWTQAADLVGLYLSPLQQLLQAEWATKTFAALDVATGQVKVVPLGPESPRFAAELSGTIPPRLEIPEIWLAAANRWSCLSRLAQNGHGRVARVPETVLAARPCPVRYSHPSSMARRRPGILT
jgi:hypothetical protein